MSSCCSSCSEAAGIKQNKFISSHKKLLLRHKKNFLASHHHKTAQLRPVVLRQTQCQATWHFLLLRLKLTLLPVLVDELLKAAGVGADGRVHCERFAKAVTRPAAKR